MTTKENPTARELAQGFQRFSASGSSASSLIPPGATIEAAPLRSLKAAEIPTYNQIKATFKPETKQQRGNFILSEHVANQLSVEEEERKRFEAKVSERVKKQLELSEAEAKKVGLEKGIEEGRVKAFEEEKARIAALTEKLGLAIAALSEAKLKLAENYETQLIDTAFRIAEIVVHERIEERPEAIKSTLRSILEKISREENVRIRLSAHEFDAIETIKADLLTLNRGGLLVFEMDAGLTPGSCIVESDSGEIASFVDEKITRLREEMAKLTKSSALTSAKVATGT